MADIDKLLDATVEEQEQKLSELSREELENLRTEETRRTAVQNIDSELDRRSSHEEENQDPREAGDKNGGSTMEERIEELEAKVEYLIEKGKTVSPEGFNQYED